MKSATKNFLIRLNKDIFIISAASFATLFFIELIKPKFVIAYLNFNYLLLICLISGMVIILNDELETERESQKKISFDALLLISIATFIFITLFTRDLGGWGALLGSVGGIVVFLLGITLSDTKEVIGNKEIKK